jgi:hypothetical protein
LKASIAASVLALFFAAGAFAQTVYKSTMPDGKVVYGEKPAPGAKRIDKIDPPPATTGTTVITPQEKARAEQIGRKPAAGSPGQQGNAAADARKQLEQAEAAREAGREPLPSERQGTKGGGSRLTDAYQERQKSLDDAVEAARRRANDAR